MECTLSFRYVHRVIDKSVKDNDVLDGVFVYIK